MKPEPLLTRDVFRNSVFQRDNFKCVCCGAPAQDAHHIIERRLFGDGGYYLSNGASLCGECHIKAEQTLISVNELREKIGVKNPKISEHLYRDSNYDKWGNLILSNGMRTKGELFNDESVQKILAPVLSLFTDYVKYPRTYHLPWSEGATDDDRVLSSIDIVEYFCDKEVVVTLKLDGENSNLYHDYFHARSIDGNSHPSQGWIKNFHASIKHEIPKGWRLCGENLYAKHSIHYKYLKSYFYLFSIWDEKNVCLSWKDTELFAQLLDIELVPVIYAGVFDQDKITKAFEPYKKDHEGYVVRNVNSFSYDQFSKNIAKLVRKNHVQTSHNWRFEKIVKNEIIKDEN